MKISFLNGVSGQNRYIHALLKFNPNHTRTITMNKILQFLSSTETPAVFFCNHTSDTVALDILSLPDEEADSPEDRVRLTEIIKWLRAHKDLELLTAFKLDHFLSHRPIDGTPDQFPFIWSENPSYEEWAVVEEFTAKNRPEQLRELRKVYAGIKDLEGATTGILKLMCLGRHINFPADHRNTSKIVEFLAQSATSFLLDVNSYDMVVPEQLIEAYFTAIEMVTL